MILPFFHTPVLLRTTIDLLRVKAGGKYIDATAGGAGHLLEILKLGGRVLAIDQDGEAIEYLEKKFKVQSSKFKTDKEIFIRQGNFRDIKEIARRIGWQCVDGILFDLGMSSYQIEGSGRGFSYNRDEMLDMRMDRQNIVTAADILQTKSKEELYEIFTKFAEELHSWAIVEALFRARSVKKIEKVGDVVAIVDEVLEDLCKHKDEKQHRRERFATLARIFQALRIVVNDELENLKKGLIQAIDLVGKDGVVAVISYHSLEDRIVKQLFYEWTKVRMVQMIARKPITAQRNEVEQNPRARSAKLRAVQKL